MKFYFVRHGQTQWNVEKRIQGKTDVPLNEQGLKQAEQFAEMLACGNYGIDRVYSSPQKRCLVMAQIVADALGTECVAVEKFVEMNMGEWEGSNWDIIASEKSPVYEEWMRHRRYTKTPGGECYDEVLKRTLEALSEILGRETGNVLVVTHSAILLTLRCYLAQCPFEDMADKFKTKNAEMIEVEAEKIVEAGKRYASGQ